MAAECEKFLELSSEEIEVIISPTNTKRATAWGVSLFKGEFLLFFCVVYTVKGMKCLFFYGLLKLNIKTFKALFVRALSGFTSTRSRTRNSKFNTALGCASCSVKFLVSCS